jgi:hypothetical protein|tara:strand:- start:1683 stop:2234 length:552 start_codon:yes stop_codon:yes gene_type:complete
MSDEEAKTDASKTVPYARFQEINTRAKESASRVQELEAQLSDTQKQASAADSLFEQLQKTNETLEAERKGFQSEKAMMESGLVSQEARDLAQWSYSRLPEENRPALGEWLQGMTGDDAEVPTYLAPYFSRDQKPSAPSIPDTNRSAVPHQVESNGFQPGSIGGMTPTEYKEHREKILARYFKK